MKQKGTREETIADTGRAVDIPARILGPGANVLAAINHEIELYGAPPDEEVVGPEDTANE